MCLEFIETLLKETIVSDARRVALTIQASTARVILIFCWYTEVKNVFLELAKINVSDCRGHLCRQKGLTINKDILFEKTKCLLFFLSNFISVFLL